MVPRGPPPSTLTACRWEPAPHMSPPAAFGTDSCRARLPAHGEVAQLVEHTAENRGVAGSTPALAISRPQTTFEDLVKTPSASAVVWYD